MDVGTDSQWRECAQGAPKFEALREEVFRSGTLLALPAATAVVWSAILF
jgi:hypothetical protein